VVDYRDEWEDYMLGTNNYRIGRVFYSLVKKLATSLYSRSHLVAAVTDNYVETLKKRKLMNTELVPNGADVRAFRPLKSKSKKETFTIFYSGEIGGYYRLDVVVKSMKKLVDRGLRNIQLVVAGEGQVQSMLDLADELGILNHLTYKGAISNKDELAHFVAEADLGVIPYDSNPLWRNSIPAKFYEYCACGLPVIATVHEDSSLALLIKKHGIGISSPPLNEEKLAKAIHWIYRSEVFREAAGKRARLLIEEKFDRNKIAEGFLSLIETIAGH